jgi:hypothetical protein
MKFEKIIFAALFVKSCTCVDRVSARQPALSFTHRNAASCGLIDFHDYILFPNHLHFAANCNLGHQNNMDC